MEGAIGAGDVWFLDRHTTTPKKSASTQMVTVGY